MNTSPENLASPPPETSVKNILAWLAMTHGKSGTEDSDQLGYQLLLLRETAVPVMQRIKLLDLLHGQAEKIVRAELPLLRETSLPVSRKVRQRAKALLDLLDALTKDYFNTLTKLFDPLGANIQREPHVSLRRAMHAIAWQITISHLTASPPRIGIWRQLHLSFRLASNLDLEKLPGPLGSTSIQRTYANILLPAIAQPASFSSAELCFIKEYIERSSLEIKFLTEPPSNQTSVFWIDPDKDCPAHPMVRRPPPPETELLYFSCDELANRAASQLSELRKNVPASTLGLPIFAETHAGKGVLQRLSTLWGEPAKRKFPRRRQSYRANLCSGLDQLWHLVKTPDYPVSLSEWMVTNESPNGYALMHMSGPTQNVRLGDIVALQAHTEEFGNSTWHVCIIRWAISESPEHVELGLEILSPHAIAAEIIQPDDSNQENIAALILPETPPLRFGESLVVPGGTLSEGTQHIVVLMDKKSREVRQIHTTHLDEQTSSVDVFSVSPDDLK